MADFSKWAGSLGFRGKVERSLRRSFSRALAFFGGDDMDGAEDAERRRMMLSLVRTVMETSGPLSEEKIESFRSLLADNFSPPQIEKMVADLREAPAVTAKMAAVSFRKRPRQECEQLLRMLHILALNTNCAVECDELISELALQLGFSEDELERLKREIEEAQLRRARIIRSGAGVIVAVMVIAVFILTATLLRSVIFGLIAAYVMLPLEKYFERRLRQKRGPAYWLFRLGETIFGPLTRLAGAIQRRRRTGPPPISEKKRRDRRIITQAVALTCGVVLIAAIVLVSAISALTNHYVRNIKWWTQIQAAEQFEAAGQLQEMSPGSLELTRSAELSLLPAAVPAEEESTSFFGFDVERLLGQTSLYLERLRDRFEKLPMVKLGLDHVSRLLHDENAQHELAGYLLKRTGGLFSFTAGVINTIVVILVDLLLTTFFFLLFLIKLAEFCGPNYGANRQSEYLVRTVFNGEWLPGASAETVAEAQRIIGEVIHKLRIWVRGYLTLMCVDATVYTIAFFFLGVPYFPILGLLAGSGILLPYIGPVLSASITILVTLAAGGDAVSGLQLAGILLTYLIYNGVVEQFILYPAVIGESLGLSTLETIIVVLLGAVFAGIPGMILALPTASVIKYLVPQIYNAWGKASPFRRQTPPH